MLGHFIFALIIWLGSAQELVVELPSGKVQGTTLDSPSGRQFYTWRHIPYAKPPLGIFRFQPPSRPDPWTGILDGSRDAKACHFVGSYPGDPVPTYGYSEDCLYINVYSPFKANSTLKLPVMFWIFGGGFYVGTGDFAFTDPTQFLEEDVIVVTFNYRLSIFGFLSMEDGVLPGNSALKDQLAALVWTRQNIGFFGGNPEDITIFGESAGAVSVSYHIISPKSRDLFQAAIMQSGTSLLNLLQTDGRNNALMIASLVDSVINQTSSSEDILRALQNADADLLVNLTLAQGCLTCFRPVVEIDNVTPFLTQPFYESLEAGNISKVPVIIGTNSEENIFIAPDIQTGLETAKEYDRDSSLLLPKFKLQSGVSVETVTQKIKEAYVGNGTFVDNLGGLVRWSSDDQYVRPTMRHAILQSKHVPVYFYKFSFVGTRSKNHPVIPDCGRVAHAEDVPYLFNISTKPIKTDADFLTRRRLVKLWTNFAKNKNPTPKDDSAELLQNVTWEPFDEDNLQYLEIDENLEFKYNRQAELTTFWKNLWDTYSYRPYTTF